MPIKRPGLVSMCCVRLLRCGVETWLKKRDIRQNTLQCMSLLVTSQMITLVELVPYRRVLQAMEVRPGRSQPAQPTRMASSGTSESELPQSWIKSEDVFQL